MQRRQRALARAAGADHADHVAAVHVERHALQHFERRRSACARRRRESSAGRSSVRRARLGFEGRRGMSRNAETRATRGTMGLRYHHLGQAARWQAKERRDARQRPRDRRADRRDRHAGADRRPRRVRAQPATRWRRSPRERGIRLRPHAKTHKCPTIALLQIAAGAVGQCCQKVGEAEALVRGGVRDVLVSNEVVGAAEAAPACRARARGDHRRCASTRRSRSRPRRSAAIEAGVTLDGLVEIDVGMQRCGVETPAGGGGARAAHRRSAGARLSRPAGVSRHRAAPADRGGAPGGDRRRGRDRARDASTRCARRDCAARSSAAPAPARSAWRARAASWNELQAGLVPLHGHRLRAHRRRARRRATTSSAHSLFVLATVMSTPTPTARSSTPGSSRTAAEKGLPVGARPRRPRGHRRVRRARQDRDRRRRARRCSSATRSWLIPGHCDPTINLHDWYVGVRNGRVETLWPITARGAST